MPHLYANLAHVVANNVVYLANLAALEQWYVHVRRPFFVAQELGELIYEGALKMLSLARRERVKRLTAMADKVPSAHPGGQTLRERAGEVAALFDGEPPATGRDAFLTALRQTIAEDGTGETTGPSNLVGRDYTQTIQRLPAGVAAAGVAWLQGIVDSLCGQADELLQPLHLFGRR